MDTPIPPIPDSYWVRPNQLLAGEYPRTPETQTSRTKLSRFLSAGVTFLLDLTEAGEYNLKPYASLLRDLTVGSDRPPIHHRLPIQDMGTPSPARMKQILDTIDTALSEGEVVYLHCFGGIGRTGTVVGCYLVRHGLSGEAALAEIARLRQNTPDDWQESPETTAQRQMVLEWPVGA